MRPRSTRAPWVVLAAAPLLGCATKDNPLWGATDGGGGSTSGQAMATSGDSDGAGPDGGSQSSTTGSNDTGGSATSSPNDPTAGSASSTGEGDGTTGAGSALLEISDGPVFDFQLANVGSTASHTFTVSNTGDIEATSIVPVALPAPYAFVGGAFPGTGGDCTQTLAAGDACSIEVEFAPTAMGSASASVELDYASSQGTGTASVDVVGAGGGTTDNLLVNPGGESGGNPPNGWTDIGNTGWIVYGGIRRTGSVSLAGPGVGGQAGTYRLQQIIDLTPYTALIDDQAGLAIALEGYARSWGNNDDIHRFLLRTRDAQGAEVESVSSPNGSGTNWTLRQLDLTTQPGVRDVEVQIICVFNAGSACDAYFDDLTLRLTYPAP